MKKKYVDNLKKTLYIIPYICFMSLSDIILAEKQETTLAELLWYGVFGRLTNGEFQSFVLSIECLGAIFIFGLLYGDSISKYFGAISSIFFTRLKSKRDWIIKKSIYLSVLSCFWVLFMVCVKFAILTRHTYEQAISVESVRALIVIGALLAPVVLIVCLVINWIAINHGEPIGMLIVFVFVISMEVVAIWKFENRVNMIFNPLCFNINILYSTSNVLLKLLVELAYCAVVILGIVKFVERRDIL